MISLDLGKHRKARVWVDEFPDAVYLTPRTSKRETEGKLAPNPGPRLAAVEALVPLGGRFLYGLLGGQWTASTTGKFIADVGVTDTPGRLFTKNLAGRLDEVRVGLPDYCAAAVLKGVEVAQKDLGALPSGRLSINCAAHGVVGSCEPAFRHLAAILIKLFSANIEPSSKALLGLFPAAWMVRS